MSSSIPIQNLPKHKKYQSAYKSNDFFWGLGVEHETYVESANTIRHITKEDVIKLQRPERYSVSYYKSYRPSALYEGITNFFTDVSHISIPVLLNSHAFTRTDIYNQSETTYEKEPRPNPKFNGETLHIFAQTRSLWFREQYDNIYLFDGDTIEFTTLNFYKADVSDVIYELQQQHAAFIENLNSLQWPPNSFIGNLAPFKLQGKNYPFATYTTNPMNISMFNNGTMHINITLPTQLDASGEIVDWDFFVKRHQILARLVQWIEPFLITAYGTPDPFSRNHSQTPHTQYIFGGASQRLSVSRYIGVGTFDTHKMPRGKILQVPRNSLSWPIGSSQDGWYPDGADWAYEPLEHIGLDINFNKHRNHGLEFRFFDSISMESLEEVLRLIVSLGRMAEKWDDNYILGVPQESTVWKKLARGSLEKGGDFRISCEDIQYIFQQLKINVETTHEHTLLSAFNCLNTCMLCNNDDTRVKTTEVRPLNVENGSITADPHPSSHFLAPVSDVCVSKNVINVEIISPTKSIWCCF